LKNFYRILGVTLSKLHCQSV